MRENAHMIKVGGTLSLALRGAARVLGRDTGRLTFQEQGAISMP